MKWIQKYIFLVLFYAAAFVSFCSFVTLFLKLFMYFHVIASVFSFGYSTSVHSNGLDWWMVKMYQFDRFSMCVCSAQQHYMCLFRIHEWNSWFALCTKRFSSSKKPMYTATYSIQLSVLDTKSQHIHCNAKQPNCLLHSHKTVTEHTNTTVKSFGVFQFYIWCLCFRSVFQTMLSCILLTISTLNYIFCWYCYCCCYWWWCMVFRLFCYSSSSTISIFFPILFYNCFAIVGANVCWVHINKIFGTSSV